MDGLFINKRALVTGASKGIGREIALALAKSGAKVVALGRCIKDLETLKESHHNIEQVLTVDLRDWQTTKTVLKNIKDVDLLVNSAGEGQIKSILEITDDDIDRIFGLNLKALMNVTQHVVEDMLKRNSPGSIVNISSQASLVGLQCQTVYCASKGAVDSFTRALALELGPKKIRVNCVNPTVVMTEMGKKWWTDPVRSKEMMSKIPLGRFAEVSEVVDAVLFLLSDKAGMITGTALPIDGGFCSS